MLTPNHPHAWNPQYADQHLDPDFRTRYMPVGSQLVVTHDMRRLIEGIPAALPRSKASVVSGPYGSGKTTLLQALAAVSDVNTVMVEIPESAGAPKAQWEVLTGALTGSATGTARRLQQAALDYLVAVPTLLIVDEAQHLALAALRQLRWLWSRKIPQFAIVLGGSDLIEHIAKDKSVATRVNQRIRLREHSTETMVKRLQASSPAFAATDRKLLKLIDEAYADGVWRNHAELMLKLNQEFGYDGPLTLELAEAVIYDRTGEPLAVTRAGAPAPTGPRVARASR